MNGTSSGSLNAQRLLRTLVLCLLVALPVWSQFSAVTSPSQSTSTPGISQRDQRSGELHWTPFGNTLVLAGVAGSASGPVERVWRSADETVYVFAEALGVHGTRDFASWTPDDTASPPVQPDRLGLRTAPHDAFQVHVHPLDPTLVYAIGAQVYRSLDGGRTFAGLTRYRGVSLLGEVLYDLSLNDSDPLDLLVASDLGLWRSRDGGLSWAPVSGGLDNLQIQRILAFPQGRRGLLAAQPGGRVLEWVPGGANGWRQLADSGAEAWRPPAAMRLFADNLTAWDANGSQLYVGLRNGVIAASEDNGVTWKSFSLPGWGATSQIVVHPEDPLLAVALATDENGRALVLRTLNGGSFWEDVTPAGFGDISALAPDWDGNRLVFARNSRTPRATGGFEGELIVTAFDFRGMASPQEHARFPWHGLQDSLRELRLDPSGTLLFAVTHRSGIFFTALPATGAPLRVRHAADLGRRPASPGDLLTIHGSPLASLRANGREAVVLGPADQSTQVQLPYGLNPGPLSLEFSGSAGETRSVALDLRQVSPAIFLHPDGSPFVLHAESGALIDENYPAAPGERIQVLLSGLGAVRPDWPAGLPVPADAPPSVIASVEATLNGMRLPVSRAVLAPGYAGIYLVEFTLPAVLDEGLADLQVMANGTGSNIVALHVAYPWVTLQ
jgi:uncharacterized protein (TIGR03437 family)